MENKSKDEIMLDFTLSLVVEPGVYETVRGDEEISQEDVDGAKALVQAAYEGNHKSELELAQKLYGKGLYSFLFKTDEYIADYWLKRAIAAHYGPAERVLGLMNISKEAFGAIQAGVNFRLPGWTLTVFEKKDDAEGYRLLEAAAKDNDLEAEKILAFCTANGLLTKKDPQASIYWLAKIVSESNDAVSKKILALDYLNGVGVAKDLNRAYFYAFDACKSKVSKAALDAEGPLANGNGFSVKPGLLALDPSDYAALFNGALKTAESGNLKGLALAELQVSIGVCYYEGRGVNQDFNKAFEWFNKGYQNGSKVALFNLAKCYRSGLGTKQDVQKGTELMLQYLG